MNTEEIRAKREASDLRVNTHTCSVRLFLLILTST